MKEKEANSWMLNIIPGNCPLLRLDIVFFVSWDMQCVTERGSQPLAQPQTWRTRSLYLWLGGLVTSSWSIFIRLSRWCMVQ